MSAAPAARSRRYRQDGAALTDGFTVRLPVGVDGDARRIARILGVTLGDFATRALVDGIHAALADPDVRDAVEALRRLDRRRGAQPVSGDSPPPATPRTRGAVGRQDQDVPDPAGRRLASTRAQAEAQGPLSHADASPCGRAQEPQPAAPTQAPAPASPPRVERAVRREGPPKRRGPAPEITPEERRRVGSVVRAARRARHMTQQQVADEMGVKFQTVSAIENGRSGTGAGAERVKQALAWAQAPHRLDDAEPEPPPPPKRANGVGIAWRRRRRATGDTAPAPDWRAPADPPMALAMELYRCDALNVRLTETGCVNAKASGRAECRQCPGVRALADRAA